MEVDERPTEQYSDIGGLDKQIQEVSTSSVGDATNLLLTPLVFRCQDAVFALMYSCL